MNGVVRIDQIFAWVITDKSDGTEGIPAWQNGGTWMPMVGADMDRMKSLRPAAQQVADMHGAEVRLTQFSTRRVIARLQPSGAWNDPTSTVSHKQALAADFDHEPEAVSVFGDVFDYCDKCGFAVTPDGKLHRETER